jgi:AcrR family transcriptional regulator
VTIGPPATLRELVSRYSSAQLRTLDVALGLFAQKGVGGTSLQMIADALGVTKAAVYHQFQTKDAIVVGVVQVQLEPVEAIVEQAEASGSGEATRETLLGALLDVVVTNRRSLSTLQSDPVLFRQLNDYEPSLQLWTRLFRILVGADLDDRALVRISALSASLGVVAYPLVVDIDGELVRDELYRLMHPLVFGSRVSPQASALPAK